MSHSEHNDPAIVYEITASVEITVIDDFIDFMVEEHIPALLETGHFSSATIARDAETLRISYMAKSREDLSMYLDQHASRLRAEVIERFPVGISIERNEWELLGIQMPR